MIRSQIHKGYILVALGREATGGKDQEEIAGFIKRYDGGYMGNGRHLATPNGDRLDIGRPWLSHYQQWARKPLKERQKLLDLGKWDPTYPPEPPSNALILKVYRRTLRPDRTRGLGALPKIVSK